MYKEIIIVLIILVLIFGADFMTQKYTETSVEEVSKSLNSLREKLVVEEETEEYKENLYKIQEKWNSYYKALAFYIEHNELEKVNEAIIALRSSIDTEEYANGVESLDRAVFVLNHIKEKEAFNITNIF